MFEDKQQTFYQRNMKKWKMTLTWILKHYGNV